MSDPRVSILIPTYNHARYLGEAIDSALGQAFPSLEVLVVDNASTDETPAVIAARSGDPRLRAVRNERNIGMVPNWNRAADLARGAYLVVLSSDDRLRPGMVERAAAVLDRNPLVGFVHGTAAYIDASGRITEERHAQDHREDFIRPGLEYLPAVVRRNPVIFAASLFRRSAAGPSPIFEERFRMIADQQLWLRILLGHDAAFIAAPAAEYRIHEGQMTHRLRSIVRAEVAIACSEALLAARATGRVDPAALAPLERSIARECLRLARRLGREPAAGRGEAVSFLRRALKLSKRALLHPDLYGALARLAGSKIGLRRAPRE
jgi:glycosyltransferase involved in cell wall biosynthesis